MGPPFSSKGYLMVRVCGELDGCRIRTPLVGIDAEVLCDSMDG